MRLSILICTIPERKDKFFKLTEKLTKQINENVEVLYESDNRVKSVGEKRNSLLSSATGDYVCFIDDDDDISDDYISKILEAIETEPDCVAINLRYFHNNEYIGLSHHSIKYFSWKTVKTEAEIFFERTPNHLNPIRRSKAILVKFPEVSHGEDHAWSNEIKQYLHTEVNIDEPIYFYYHEDKK